MPDSVAQDELDEMKDWLRVEHDEEDGLIRQLIREAWAAAEDFCRTPFDWATAPSAVRLAIRLMVSHYYENRDNPDKQGYLAMRLAFENLLYPHRDPETMF